YTTVAEFHYLHHAPGGAAYASPSEMAQRILAAADTGIGLCLLPVLYSHSGFGGRPPTAGQQRFVHDVGGYLALWADLDTHTRERANTTLGIAFHSLRAVTPEQIATVAGALADPAAIHIHIAEQT